MKDNITTKTTFNQINPNKINTMSTENTESKYDMSKFNNNYINSFLERIETAVAEDAIISEEDYDKALSFYDHKAGILTRKVERILDREKKRLEKENAALKAELGEDDTPEEVEDLDAEIAAEAVA
jgi:replicative superfamily II helicase